MAKRKVKAVEDVIIEDDVIVGQDVQEVTLNLPVPELEAPGHHSRDLKDILK